MNNINVKKFPEHTLRGLLGQYGAIRKLFVSRSHGEPYTWGSCEFVSRSVPPHNLLENLRENFVSCSSVHSRLRHTPHCDGGKKCHKIYRCRKNLPTNALMVALLEKRKGNWKSMQDDIQIKKTKHFLRSLDYCRKIVNEADGSGSNLQIFFDDFYFEEKKGEKIKKIV